jgi:peptidyl-prolyl cis-trans isomerase SurA
MTTLIGRLFGAAALSAVACASIAGAQTVSDGGALPNTGLNLPSTLSTFGKVEPNLRKATAIVNGEIITGTDVDQRLALIVVANGGAIPADELERLRVQVLRNLIDETLQIQEAKANKIEITKGDVEGGFNSISQRFRRSPQEMTSYLRTVGSSDRSMRRQIEGEVAWSRLLRRKVEVNVSDAEVNQVLERLKAARGTDEYHVGEIYLSATPDNAQEVTANARRIIDQIRQGGSFQAYARQFSEASTAVVGGDLGWIRAAQLPDSLGQAVQEISVGQLVGPIEVPGGLSILYLIDARKVLMADPRDAVLSLRQLSINFPAGMSSADAQAKATSFGQAAQTMGGCGRVEEFAQAQGADLVDNDQVKVRELPPPLQDMLLGLQIGQASPPFGSQKEGVRVLVLCGRDDPAAAGDPDPEQLRNRIEEERTAQRAQRYLRDLRRDAVVDYR